MHYKLQRIAISILSLFIVLIFSHQYVYAEEMTMKKGENHSINSNLSGCQSSNPVCVSASESYTNQSGLYHCTFVAIGDNCKSTVTIGGAETSRVINVTVGDPSKAESTNPPEEINITLKVESSFSYPSDSKTCVSDNPSCVSAKSSTASSIIGSYSCKLQAIAPDCSANVTVGFGDGAKLVHVKTQSKNGSESTTGGSQQESNENNNVGSLTCDYILGKDYNDPQYLSYYLVRLLDFIKMAGPILVIVMTIVDLVKFVATGKNDELNKLAVKSLKRIIFAVLLFIIPTILDSLFKFFSVYGVCLPE